MTEEPITPEETTRTPLTAAGLVGEETPLPDAPEERTDAAGEELDEDRKRVIESLIFASEEPISFREVKILLEGESAGAQKREMAGGAGENTAGEEGSAEREMVRMPKSRRRAQRGGISSHLFRRYIAALNGEYQESGRSFRIVEIAGGYTFQTTKEFAAQVGKMFAEKAKRRLTHSALETLAIVAFRQPISKPSIEAIRGVNADFVLKSLLEKDLVTIVGRDEGVGRPLLYGTTDTFLKHFGIARIEDLPKPREIEELLAEEDLLGTESIEIEEPEDLPATEIGIPAEDGIFKTMPYGENFEFEQAVENLPEQPIATLPDDDYEANPAAIDVPLRVEIDAGESPAEKSAVVMDAAEDIPSHPDDFEEEE